MSHCGLLIISLATVSDKWLSKKSVFEKVMRHNSGVKRNILAFRPELCLIEQ